jgi:uncharacterized protein
MGIRLNKELQHLKHWLLLLFLILTYTGIVQAQAFQNSLPKPPQGKAIGDYANIIDEATEQRLETTFTNLRERAGIEFGIATVDTIGDNDIFDYSLGVARGWGIGPGSGEKNGLLLFVAVKDRKYYIQVSRHLEGDLPDGYVGSVGRRMQAPFRANNYSEGVMAAVQTLIATLGQKRGFSIEGIDESYAIREAPRRRPQRSTGSLSACGVIFIIAIILIFLLSSRGGGAGGGCLNLLLLNTLLNSGRGYSSGWGGGSSGSSGWGDGGGGFGGFGGGGDFGGGGAGGDW